jgi:hypothetical protein
MQQEVPHPGWIDLLPCPQLRDNLILAVIEFNVDEDEILEDLIGDIFESMGCSSDGVPIDGPPTRTKTPEKPHVVTPEAKEALKSYTPTNTPVGNIGLGSYRKVCDQMGIFASRMPGCGSICKQMASFTRRRSSRRGDLNVWRRRID